MSFVSFMSRIALAALVAGSASANNSGLFLSLPLSVRQAGMGDINVGGHDVLRAWSNPSVLALGGDTYELTGGAARILGDEEQQVFGAAWRPSAKTGFAVLFGHHAIRFNEVNAAGEEGHEVVSQMTAPALAAAGTFGRIHAGLAVKYVGQSDMVGPDASGVAGDAGLSLIAGNLTAGFAAQNIGAALSKEEKFTGSNTGGSGGKGSLPTDLRGGLAWHSASLGLTAAAEVVSGNGSTRIGLGAEYWIAKVIGIRAGVADLSGEAMITAGLSAVWSGLGVDYAFLTHAALGASHRATLSYVFSAAPSATTEQPVMPPPVVRKPGDKKLNFAISDLRAENVSAGDAAVMGDLLRSELVRTGAFNMVEKQNMEKVLAEHAFQQTGCTSEECAVKLGKLLNVQVMGVGSFGKLLDAYFLNIRIVNIETGQVAVADSAEGKTVSDLKIAVRDMALRLAATIQ